MTEVERGPTVADAAPRAFEPTVADAAHRALEPTVADAAPRALEPTVADAAPRALEPTVADAAPRGPEPLPTGTRERLIQVACGAGLLLQSVRYYVTLPFLAYLLTRPLRYELIHPSTISLVVGGAYARVGRDPAWAVVLCGVVGLSCVDPLRWLAGHRYGDRVALLLAGNNAAIVARVERFTARWGTWGLVFAWFTPIPLLFIQVAAGTAGMSFRRFLVADLAGTLLWVLAVAGLGYGVGQPAVKTVKHIAHYSLQVTIVAVVVGVGFGAWRARRAQRG